MKVNVKLEDVSRLLIEYQKIVASKNLLNGDKCYLESLRLTFKSSKMPEVIFFDRISESVVKDALTSYYNSRLEELEYDFQQKLNAGIL